MTDEQVESNEPAAIPPGTPDIEVPLSGLAKPFAFEALFGRVAPVEIEIGFGSGIFLALHAPTRPAVNFLGIERDIPQVRRTKDKLQRRGITNVRLLRADALYVLEEYVPAASVQEYHIYFSDPWPKNRHHKRRVFSPRLLPPLERTLAPGGILRVKTDVSEYYEVMVALLDPAPFLEKLSDERLDIAPRADDIVTNFQRKAIEAGHPIHSMVYRRR